MIRKALRVSPLAYRIHQLIERESLIPPGSRVVVGVSGGPDSVALLSLLAELREPSRLRLWGVYVNHRWRPHAARREAALVRQIGQRLGVPITVVTVAPRKRSRHSWEGTARVLRYAALSRVARRRRAAIVVVGHTLEDQAETVLLALLRGAGLTGVAGMPLARPLEGDRRLRLVRPLLESRRAELKRHLRQQHLPWAEDATNRQDRFRRNRVRRLLLALRREFGPHVIERLATFARLAHDENAWWEAQIARWGRRHSNVRSGVVRLSLKALRRHPVAWQRRLLRWGIARAAGSLQGVTSRHIAALVHLVQCRSGMVHLPHGLLAQITHGALRLRRRRLRRL